MFKQQLEPGNLEGNQPNLFLYIKYYAKHHPKVQITQKNHLKIKTKTKEQGFKFIQQNIEQYRWKWPYGT